MKRMPTGFTDEQRDAPKDTTAELADAERRRQAHIRSLAVIGKVPDIEGKTDVAEHHDDYFADAIWEDLQRKRP